MPALAEFDNVVKFYGPHQALGPVTVTIPDRTVGLLGPNGAGKTTFIRLLMGLMAPSAGTLRVLGEDVTHGNTSLRRRIGYLPEGEAAFPELTGVEAVTFAGRLVGMPKAEALQRAHQVLDYVQLGEARYRFVEKYSTGMRQRLKLAQALVHDPELLILDEPTEGVDPEARTHILDLLAELEREHGLHLLLSTHLLHDVERLASHAVVLNEGQLAAHGSLDQLKSTRKDEYVVRVNGSPEPLTEALTAAGLSWEPMLPSVKVKTDDPKALLGIVAEAGLIIRSIAPLEMSLQDAFEQAVTAPALGYYGGD